MDSNPHDESEEMPSTSTIVVPAEPSPTIEQPKKKSCYPVRYNLMILGWFAAAGAYSLRIDLNVAIVAMVNQTYAENFKDNDTHEFTSYCPSHYNKSSNENDISMLNGNIDWTPSQQGVVLSAFFIGYFCSQIPWGVLAQKLGGKNTVGFGLLVCSILSLLTPSAAETSFVLAVVVRGLMGVAQGSVYPGLIYLMGKWAPVGERSLFSAVIGTGSSAGAIISTFVTSFLSEHDYLGGWRTSFYIFGGTVCVWFVFWMLSMHNFPAEHPRISRAELNYIETSLASATATEKDQKVPWMLILKSISIWSLCAVLFCNSWFYYALVTFMPTYMAVILGLTMDDNGIYSSLTYMAGMTTTILGGLIADWMINRGIKINTTRKFMTALSLIPESLFLFSVGFLGCRSDLVILMFILTRSFGGLSDAGIAVASIDIAPRYSGVVYAIGNCMANFSGVLAPLVTGYIVNVEESLDQWKKVFFLASGINTFGMLIFLCFARVEKVAWSDGVIEKDDQTNLIDETSAEKTL